MHTTARVISLLIVVTFSNVAFSKDFSISSFRELLASQLQIDQLSIWWTIALSTLGGLLTNLTPCVYPMIPITLRLIGGSGRNSLKNSVLYALGIVLTYTVLGVSAALGGGLFGSFMANKFFNLLVAGFMFLMAFSMLGFANFSFFQRIGNRLGNSDTSFKRFILMGCGAGLVAAPCTGPILAALLTVAATKSDAQIGSLSLFFYSLGFAFPYIFLGHYGKKLLSIKVNPELLVAVKTLFSAVMFSLGFYYLRVPFYSVLPIINQYWFECVMGGFAVAFVAFAVHLSKRYSKFDSILSVVGALSLGFVIYSVIGWTSNSQQSEIGWIRNESEAFELAKKFDKPIIIDFWAEWCAACKQMDESTFRDKRVVKILSESWVTLKFDLTEDNDVNSAVTAKYKLFGLPALLLIAPDGNMEDSIRLDGFVSAEKLHDNMLSFPRSSDENVKP